jgi:hypothetical protein
MAKILGLLLTGVSGILKGTGTTLTILAGGLKGACGKETGGFVDFTGVTY